MKKLKYSSPFYSRDYFSKNILPNSVYAGRKSIRQQIPFKQHDELELLLVRRGEGTVTVNGSANAWQDVFTHSVSNISFAKAAERGESGEVTENGIKITESKGWQESLYAKWTLVSDAKSYNVYVKGGQYADYTKILL